MSDLSKFADELEQLILNHAEKMGVELCETLIEHVIRVVTKTLFEKKEDENGKM